MSGLTQNCLLEQRAMSCPMLGSCLIWRRLCPRCVTHGRIGSCWSAWWKPICRGAPSMRHASCPAFTNTLMHLDRVWLPGPASQRCDMHTLMLLWQTQLPQMNKAWTGLQVNADGACVHGLTLLWCAHCIACSTAIKFNAIIKLADSLRMFPQFKFIVCILPTWPQVAGR